MAITNPESEAAVEREKSVIKKEKQEEDDDEETLKNARQWDDWKDGRLTFMWFLSVVYMLVVSYVGGSELFLRIS